MIKYFFIVENTDISMYSMYTHGNLFKSFPGFLQPFVSLQREGGEEFSNMWVKVLAKFHPFAKTLDTIYTLSIAFSFLTAKK